MSNPASNRFALIISTDSDFVERAKKALHTTHSDLQPVVAPNAMNALGRMEHVNYEIVFLAEKNPKLGPDFMAKKILQTKGIFQPKHFFLFEDAPSGDVKPANFTSLLPGIQEADLIASLKTVVLENAITPAKSPAPFKMDVNFINPFIDSTLEVIRTTCQVACHKEKVFIRGSDMMSGDISALIGMVSSNFKGSIGISFQKSTFLYMVNSMLDEKYTQINAENQDAAGELCNQIFGMTKTKLNDAGHNIQPAIPSVIIGDQHKIKHIYSGPVISVQFKCEGGLFVVEAAIVS